MKQCCRMGGAVCIVLLIVAVSSPVCSEFPLSRGIDLILDLEGHYRSAPIVLSLWRAIARIRSVGTLRVNLLLKYSIHLCREPLYVVLGHNHMLKHISDAGMFTRARWLVWNVPHSQLHQLNIPFDCEFLVLRWEDGKPQLDEVYRVSAETPLRVIRFGETRSTWPSTDLYRRRTSLDGYTVKAAILQDGIFVTTDTRNRSDVQLGGYIGTIWTELQSAMNFSSEFLESVDGGTGSENEGHWDGMVGMMVRGEAQVGASSFLMTTKRLAVVDFTHGLAEAGNNVYIKTPDKRNIQPWSSSLGPFSSYLWLCVMATMLILTVFLAAISNIVHNLRIHKESEFLFQNTWLYVFGMFCQQGHNISPQALAGRVVYITSYLCAVVLLAGYAGNYISFLSAGRPLVLPFNSFHEMLKDGSYRLGVMARSAQFDFFHNSTYPLFKDVFEKLIKPDLHNLPSDYYTAFHRVCNSKYAFMTSAVLMQQFTSRHHCRVIAVPQAGIPGFIAMTTTKNSSYRGLINYNLHKMRDTGILKVIERRILMKNDETVGNEWDSISLDEVVSTIGVFIFGVLVSVTVLAAEYFISSVFKIKSETNTQQLHKIQKVENGKLKKYLFRCE